MSLRSRIDAAATGASGASAGTSTVVADGRATVA
jgi:hypothetical protein